MQGKSIAMDISQQETTNLYLIRHGQTDWNAEGRFQGLIDRSLNEEGVRQAQSVAQHLSDFPLAALYSSPLLRAYQTAEIIASYHQMAIQRVEELRECTYGPLDGLRWEELHLRCQKELEYRESLSAKERFSYRLVEGAETGEEILQRVLPCLQLLSKKYKGQQIAIVTHGWVLRTLYIYLSRFEIDQVQIENGAMLHLLGNGAELSIKGHQGIQIESSHPPS